MVGVAKGPGLIRVKVGVPSNARAWEVGMRQEAPLAIKGWAVAMETWGEDDGDVHLPFAGLQRAVRHRFEAQRRHTLPHVKRPADGGMCLLVSHLGREIL